MKVTKLFYKHYVSRFYCTGAPHLYFSIVLFILCTRSPPLFKLHLFLLLHNVTPVTPIAENGATIPPLRLLYRYRYSPVGLPVSRSVSNITFNRSLQMICVSNNPFPHTFSSVSSHSSPVLQYSTYLANPTRNIMKLKLIYVFLRTRCIIYAAHSLKPRSPHFWRLLTLMETNKP